MKRQTETFPPVGRLWKLRNYGKKQNASLLFPTVVWISQAIKLARLIHSYHRRGCRFIHQENGNKGGGLQWVLKLG